MAPRMGSIGDHGFGQCAQKPAYETDFVQSTVEDVALAKDIVVGLPKVIHHVHDGFFV